MEDCCSHVCSVCVCISLNPSTAVCLKFTSSRVVVYGQDFLIIETTLAYMKMSLGCNMQ